MLLFSNEYSMKPPFHIRGPFMAKVWLLFAVSIVGIQVIFVINLLIHNSSIDSLNDATVDDEASTGVHTEAYVAKTWDLKNEGQADESNVVNIEAGSERINERIHLPTVAEIQQPPVEISRIRNLEPQHKIPEADVNKLETNGALDMLNSVMKAENGAASGDNSKLYDMLQNVIMQSLNSGSSQSSSGGSSMGSKISSLLPLLTILPTLTGQGAAGVASINWENYIPLLERLEHFAHFCTVQYQDTVNQMRAKYPAKAQQASFVSATAMKGFFRIFANEDQQEEFLEIANESLEILEALGLTDHIIDVMSGRLYGKLLSSGVSSVGELLNTKSGLADVLNALKTTTPASTTTKIPLGGEEEPEDDDIEEEDNAKSFISNDHFETIMESYDSMFRDDENANQTIAKMELNGRVFLQTWYESMRRYAREKGKIHAKKFSEADFNKYMESIEVPFSNILDFAYPVKNEKVCTNQSSAQVELLIMVISKTQNFPLRNSIRQTWKATAPVAVKVVFLISDRDEDRHLIQKESDQYSDIVTVDVSQTYEYTTRKTLVVLDWSSRYCPSVPYVYKTTDQMYVNAKLVLEEVRLAKNVDSADQPALIGHLVKNVTVHRIPLLLDHLFYDEYPFDVFPTFLSDFGFVMNMEFAKRGITAAKDFPLIRHEHFSISGILAAKLKATPRAFQKHDTKWLIDADMQDSQKAVDTLCANKESVVFGGKMNAPKMLFVHASLNSCPVRS